LLTLLVFLLCFVGLLISFYPYVIPGALTLWDAATDPSSQRFMLVGTVVVLPMILGYTAWSYWVFRSSTLPPHFPVILRGGVYMNQALTPGCLDFLVV
jgi:cytochrome d ubiquinol oxidase subunit II